VTRADVEQALGRRLTEGKQEREGGSSTCDYTGRDGQVTITLQRLPAKLNIAAEIDSLKRAIPESSVRPAQGLGATAFFLDIAGAGTQLHIIRGGHDYLLVSVLGFGDAISVSPVAERLARKALGRL
jgi:hypothetical protein